MLWDMVYGVIRHIATGLGGVLVAKGIANQSDATAIVGGIIAAVGVGHSLYIKWKANQNKPATTTSPIQ